MLLVGWLGLFLEHFNGLLSGLDLPRRAYVPPREEDINSHHYCRCRLNLSALDFNFWSVSANRTLIKCQFFSFSDQNAGKNVPWGESIGHHHHHREMDAGFGVAGVMGARFACKGNQNRDQ